MKDLTMTDTILLGLIGDNIAASQSPRLHRLAGLQNGRRVRYDSLIPAVEGLDFDALFARCAAGGYRGINVTYPYKEVVAGRLRIDDPLVRAIGACNTVLFDPEGPRGFNTDYSGFVAAYRRVRGERAPGAVLMIGAGGVGRAVALGLIALGAAEIRLADRDAAKADGLADALRRAAPGLVVRTGTDAAALAPGAQGLINCTPVGMVGYGGTPLPADLMAAATGLRRGSIPRSTRRSCAMRGQRVWTSSRDTSCSWGRAWMPGPSSPACPWTRRACATIWRPGDAP